MIINLLKLSCTDAADIGGSISDASDSASKLSDAISQNGFLVVGAAVLFVILFICVSFVFVMNMRILSNLSKKDEATRSADDELISNIVKRLLAEREADSISCDDLDRIKEDLKASLKRSVDEIEDNIKKIGTKKTSVDFLSSYLNLSSIFKDASCKAFDTLRCDRIGIYVFHNGNQSAYGLPFYKMSCVHEWNVTGTESLRGKHHVEMPLHVYDDFLYKLYKNSVYKCEDMDKLSTGNEHKGIREFMAYSDTKAFYIMAVKNNNNSIGGFVSVEFSSKESFEQNPDRDNELHHAIDEMVKEISPAVFANNKDKK